MGHHHLLSAPGGPPGAAIMPIHAWRPPLLAGRAAISILNILTTLTAFMPNEQTRDKIQAALCSDKTADKEALIKALLSDTNRQITDIESGDLEELY